MKNLKFLFVLSISCLILQGCQKKLDPAQYSAEEIGRYISAHMPSLIDPGESVRVRFAVPVDTTETAAVLEFTPATKGTTLWEDAQTIVFTPESGWKPGTSYQVLVNLGKIITDVDPKLKQIPIHFDVRPVELLVTFEPFTPEFDGEQPRYLLRGRVAASMAFDSSQLNRIMTVKQTGSSDPIRWIRNGDGRSYDFFIAAIHPSSTIEFRWDGQSIGSEDQGSRTIQAPAGDELVMMSFEAATEGERRVSIFFSQKLDSKQDLAGLVTANGRTDGFSVRKDNHILHFYPQEDVRGEMVIVLHNRIASSLGHTLGSDVEIRVSLEDARPGLKLVGSGVITPGAQEVVFPFEAINLRSVKVEVVRIFENNILQFLQSGDLEDAWNLMPVGRIVLQKNIDLQALSDRDNKFVWTRYTLDLAPLVKLSPGSIYQVRIGFGGEDTYLTCFSPPVFSEKEKAPYGELESFYAYRYHYEGFTWDHMDDPCFAAFYNPEHFISRNVLASDLGLIAKQNDHGDLWVYVSRLGTAEPMSGVNVEVYDYQQQSLSSAATNADGAVTFKLPRTGFFVVASVGQQKGYLKLADGLSLSLSEFDAGGTSYQEGLRGYLYAERDVWRPGDSVHLNFILWDPENKVDARHPVQLTVTNPRGQKASQRTVPISLGGIYDLGFATSSTDPTGNWMAKVQVGDAVFSKSLKIETIKPNRIRVDLKLPESIVSAQGESQIPLEAAWLFGAPASGLRANVEAQFTPKPFSPNGFKAFRFSDPARRTPSTVITLFDGALDAQGKARVQVPVIKDYLPEGQLMMSAKTRVFESGGDFSTDRHSTTFHPYDHYAGVSIPENRWGYEELRMNEENDVRLASVSPDGKGGANRKLSVGLYRANWRWWWDQTHDDITQYNSALHLGAFETDTVTTGRDGTITYKVKPTTYGSYMIRVCDLASGHCAGQFYYAGSWGDPTDDTDAASRLTFTSDQAQYEVGDQVKLSIPSVGSSKILLTLEKNDKVVMSKWYPTNGDLTEITFEATADMMPNVYAFVSHIQPYHHPTNDMPLRMYGVVPIRVADPKTMLHPEIAMPDVLAPEQSFSVTVSEKDNQAMAYTIAIVDEGLLSLTRFASPDPWGHFHKQEALATLTWDMYDDVLGGYGGTLERLLSLGGDGAATLVDAPQAQRFKPVVMHLGPFYLEAGQKKTHNLKMPNYVGAVRTMIVASDRKRWGSADKTTTVKSDLMIQPTLPRVVSAGETISLPVNVYAMADHVKTVQVNVKTNGLAAIDGPATQTVNFTAQGDQLTWFTLKVPEKIGLLKVTVSAQSGSVTTTQDIELDVRIPNPPLTEVVSATVAAGQTWTGKIPKPGIDGTNSSSLELSQMPPINLERRLGYLIRYPYGCLEQTLSSVFPQLYLVDLVELPATRQQEVRNNVQAGVNRLKNFSLPGGGFTYWPGNNTRDAWSNSYAGHFLIEATKQGYSVDRSMLDAWRNAQKKDAQAYRPGQYYRDDVNQAYRLYTLSLDGQPLWGMMNRLRVQKDLDPMAKWLLAAAYALGKRDDAATELINNLSTEVKPYQELSYTYGSEMRDKALMLQTYLSLGKTSDALLVARAIADMLSKESWYSTQATSFALVSMGKLAKQFATKGIKADVQIAGQTNESLASNKALLLKSLAVSGENITVRNTSSDPLFVRVTGTGRPVQVSTAAINNHLSLKVRYLDMRGNDLSPDRLKQGQDFVVQVQVTNPGTFAHQLDQLALAYFFPSGWEITNQRLDEMADRFKNSGFQYQDIRDDRVNTFFNMGRGVWTYHFVMTATYAGRFRLPDVSCEAMYSNAVQARIPGKWIEVVK